VNFAFTSASDVHHDMLLSLFAVKLKDVAMLDY